MDNCRITVISPSRRPQELKLLMETLKDNTDDPSNIEVILKIDEDQRHEFKEIIDNANSYPFTVQYVITPRLYGYYTMWANNHDTLKLISPDSYFVLLITDEARFNPGWDKVIRKYYKFYDDDIFRLTLSNTRYLNYYNIGQVNYLPDTFCIVTTKWLRLTNGVGDCWGADSVFQYVSYHLGRGIRSFYHWYIQDPISRNVPVAEKILGNLEIFSNLSGETIPILARGIIVFDEWARNVSQQTQTKYCYYARILYLHIKAHQWQIDSFQIVQNKSNKSLTLIDNNKNCAVLTVSYAVPWLYCAVFRLYFKLLQLKTMLKLFYYTSPLTKLFGNKAEIKQEEVVPVTLIPATEINGEVIFDTNVNIETKPKITVHEGGLFNLKDNKILPSRFFKWLIAKHRYVSCSDEELTANLERIFAKGYDTEI